MSGFLKRSKEPGVSMDPEIRIVRIAEALGRYGSGALSCLEAAGVLGMSERHFRRLRDRYEAEGVKRLSILTPDRRAKLTPLSGTAEVVPVVNRGTRAASCSALRYAEPRGGTC